jgi:sugar phosphate isomerase/epimerase
MSMDIRIGTLVRSGMASAEYIRQILPHGFESFSLMFWKTAEGTDWDRLADEVGEALQGSDAVISSIGIYGNPMESDDEAINVRKDWETCIDNAGKFGCSIVEGFTGRIRGKSIDENLDPFVSTWAPLTKRAEDAGVKIAFEICAMGGTWATGDWNIAHDPAAWEMMFNAIPSSNLGLAWEPAHQVMRLIDPIPQIQKWSDRIFTIHGKDANIDWDAIRKNGAYTVVSPEIAEKCNTHPVPKFSMQRFPGFGDTDWKQVFTELRLAGYRGSIDIEGWHDRTFKKDDLEMTGQVAALNYLKSCRGGEYVPNPVA